MEITSSASRWSRLKQRLMPGKARAKLQADEVTELVLGKLDSHDEKRKFIDLRYRDRLATHLRMAPFHQRASSVLNMVALAGAAAVTTLAAGGDPGSGWVIGLGLLVAGCTALNQVGQFGRRSALRFRAANGLRQEGWDFAVERGRYIEANYQDGSAFGLFYDTVWQIERPADEISETVPESSE
jgi:hypothetical protein